MTTTRRLALTPTECAETLGITRAHVYTLLSRGEIRSVKLGRVRRIPVAEIDRILAAAQQPAEASA